MVGSLRVSAPYLRPQKTYYILYLLAKTFVVDGPDALRVDIRRDDELIRETQKRKRKKTAILGNNGECVMKKGIIGEKRNYR